MVGVFFIGAALIGIDAISDTLFTINGFPALGIVGGALILLVLTSILNWIFKVAGKSATRRFGRDLKTDWSSKFIRLLGVWYGKFWEPITVNGQEMQMYASVPSSSAGFTAPFPAVVVAQHATGVDAFIQDICDRLGAVGYAAVAPNLYHRVTDPALLNEQPRPRPAALLSDPDIVTDINATVDCCSITTLCRATALA